MIEKENLYGIVCLNCNTVISPAKKSPLERFLKKRKKDNQEIILDYLKNKLGVNKNANRDEK